METAIATRPFDSLALTELNESKFVALHKDNEQMQALKANTAEGDTLTERDLIRVKIPPGGATDIWSYDDLGVAKQTKSIVGALVFVGRRGVLWGKDDPVIGSLPVLTSDDLLSARQVNSDIGNLDAELLKQCFTQEVNGVKWYDWRTLPYNKFGTSKNGIGKRAKESRLLAILPPDEVFPLLINATPGSLKGVTGFIKRLPVPHFRAVVSLSLEKTTNKGGQQYCRIKIALEGQLSKVEGEALRAAYTIPLSRLDLEPQADDYSAGDDSES